LKKKKNGDESNPRDEVMNTLPSLTQDSNKKRLGKGATLEALPIRPITSEGNSDERPLLTSSSSPSSPNKSNPTSNHRPSSAPSTSTSTSTSKKAIPPLDKLKDKLTSEGRMVLQEAEAYVDKVHFKATCDQLFTTFCNDKGQCDPNVLIPMLDLVASSAAGGSSDSQLLTPRTTKNLTPLFGNSIMI
jgi:hypothetical protein